jgi:hypothetical protein
MLTVRSCSVGYPGIVAEASVDLGFAFCVHDQERADAAVFASGERPAEENELLLCERVHERCMLAHCWLLGDPLPVGPGGSCFSDDGEEAHARAIR